MDVADADGEAVHPAADHGDGRRLSGALAAAAGALQSEKRGARNGHASPAPAVSDVPREHQRLSRCARRGVV